MRSQGHGDAEVATNERLPRDAPHVDAAPPAWKFSTICAVTI
jgi:hypothetical protein